MLSGTRDRCPQLLLRDARKASSQHRPHVHQRSRLRVVYGVWIKPRRVHPEPPQVVTAVCANCSGPVTGSGRVPRGPDIAWHTHCRNCAAAVTGQLDLIASQPGGRLSSCSAACGAGRLAAAGRGGRRGAWSAWTTAPPRMPPTSAGSRRRSSWRRKISRSGCAGPWHSASLSRSRSGWRVRRRQLLWWPSGCAGSNGPGGKSWRRTCTGCRGRIRADRSRTGTIVRDGVCTAVDSAARADHVPAVGADVDERPAPEVMVTPSSVSTGAVWSRTISPFSARIAEAGATTSTFRACCPRSSATRSSIEAFRAVNANSPASAVTSVLFRITRAGHDRVQAVGTPPGGHGRAPLRRAGAHHRPVLPVACPPERRTMAAPGGPASAAYLEHSGGSPNRRIRGYDFLA